ncbi:unnamed protein product [Thelazia callipaeda]|uniref:DNA polymerase kappa n=1 Tax=Thelazia callipaeda TaxID=103827 RepID=A0A0N5CWU9_THECL|nr:unnamed protein product [Thelazia callipaeda]
MLQERIEKIIDENTSSDFYGHTKKRKERIDARISSYKDIMAKLTFNQIADAEREMDILVDLLEKERDLSHYAVHIDMDAFYAAVEMRDDPSLRDIPMAVGSDSMLSTSNYAARRFGVRAAMPGFIAKKLCPQLKIIHGSFEKYHKASSVAREVFKEYDPDLCMGGLDEVYMDLSAYIHDRLPKGSIEYGRIRYTGECVCRLPLITEDEMDQLVDAEIVEEECLKCEKVRKCVRDRITFGVNVDEVVREIRFRVEQATGLTCSAGIAPNSMLAKVCSDINKPNGQFRLLNEREAVWNFMKNLPIRKVVELISISGIGPVTEAVLKGIGMETCGDLYEHRGLISLLFSQSSYEHFLRIALGIADVFTSDHKSRRKSISCERTFHPTTDAKVLFEMLENLCNELVDSLTDHNIRGGRTATVKMKYSTFDVITRSSSVGYVITDADRLFSLCSKLLRQEINCNHDSDKQLRLLGVRLARLIFHDEKAEKSNPLSLFWKSAQTNPTAMEYVTSLSDGKDQPSTSTYNVVGSVNYCNDDSDVVSKKVLCSDDQQFCPICNGVLPKELGLINRHIDECLNRSKISVYCSNSCNNYQLF